MDITKLSAFEMKQMIHEKEVSSRQLIESHFNKIDELEKSINAFITLNKEEALKAADRIDEKIKNGEKIGLLAGIPIGVKDNIMTKNLRTTCGSRMLENFIPPYDATVVERIKSADGIIIGKTNMDEFAMGSSTETSYFGVTKNPIDLERVPGGSSGGSAAAVKAGEVALALGTDTGGSIRQPASYCDVVGIKPTYGIVSRYGTVSMANTLDQVGVFGRDVKDAVLMLSSITGYDEKDSTSFKNPEGTIIFGSFPKEIDYTNYLKGMKIAIPKEIFKDDIDSRIKEEINKSIKIFESLGAEIDEISLPHLDYALAAYYIISTSELSSNLARFDGVRYGYRAKEYETLDELYINSRTEAFGEEVKRRIMLGTYSLTKGYAEDHYKKALKVRTLIKEDFSNAFSKYDVILSPTSPVLPFKFGEKIKDPLSMYKADLFTVPVNLAGLCAMSIPCGYIDGLPLGLQIIGDKYKEANIIKTGLGFEGGLKNEL
ncbi:Asp-tRNA(Asn)/Glu-tRNA(Gln) amidotransferase subunit GatA [uncultured Tissierella sp.]|jgi:aspartyl-tRNA(Asn)/glutamyl-tRNA(Gln) amidotransferase subunit A|uniref:Asp-tRNA(Asn)/Glu-tRNA(Gln) amidotransferase subunit GatA n=1 Tax=uncultured Tissierella sp. TaxID=448160 RepID=UPI002803E23C|nr:Asp-tRNA(Asn)/Glu-tRNA(Gln) amidotransferase subunit GatA [uncultured Tissierella sp.]MDU5081500.1 Asp-tRNA(Asn)/Glu-tRNA(Gln) amidotransferase subunit GatA [Bacillota bacterium]